MILVGKHSAKSLVDIQTEGNYFFLKGLGSGSLGSDFLNQDRRSLKKGRGFPMEDMHFLIKNNYFLLLDKEDKRLVGMACTHCLSLVRYLEQRLDLSYTPYLNI
jgi:hypothetical protein